MQSVKRYLRSLSFTHWGMLSIQILFLLIAMGGIDPERDNEFDLHFIISDIIIKITGFTLAYWIPLKKMQTAKYKLGLREKLQKYKKAILIRWSILSLISFYSIIAFIMTKEYIFICSTIFSITVFFLNKVNSKIIVEQLDLTSIEQQILTNPDCVI